MARYERIASLIPKRIIERFRKELEFVGIEVEEKRFVGFLFSFGLALSFAITLNLFVFLSFPLLPSFALIFFLFIATIFLWLNNVSQSKGRFVEKILPDALQLIASNIKAGLTTERALFVSARPEFGPLSDALKEGSKKILSGERIETVLLDLPKKIKSRILERTMWLISQGIRSGGEIADLLIQLSDDLREENSVKEEIKANVSMYVMLIFFAAAFGAPLLFGVSSFIVGVLAEQMQELDIDVETIQQYQKRSPIGRFMGVPTVSVTEEFIVFFAEVALFVTCIFAGLTLGAINTGREMDGVKYMPLLLIIAFLIFIIIRSVLVGLFGQIFTIF